MQRCYKTIVLLSRGFLQCENCAEMFQQAHYEVIHGQHNGIILIMMEKLDETDIIHPDIIAYMRNHTYIMYGQFMFWKRLYHALRKPLARD